VKSGRAATKPFFEADEASLKRKSSIDVRPEARFWRLQMAVVARVLSFAFPDREFEVGPLMTVTLFCGLGLSVSLLVAAGGFDLGAGFF